MTQNFIRTAFLGIKKLLKSLPVVRKMLYEQQNKDEFSSLFEHEKMIADKVRVDNYYKAICRNIKPGQTVIDIGTGTGILALFAARQGAKQVYAIDHSDFIDAAKHLAKHNKIDNVTFVNVNSHDYTPPEKVDVLLHEQIGDDLFEENMLDNLLELKGRILKEGGQILPAKFELYLEPVTLKDLYRVPFLREKTIHGLDFSGIESYEGLPKYKSQDYRSGFCPPESVDFFLCEPTPLLSFDLNQMKSPGELQKRYNVTKAVIRDGQLDGLFLYFKVIFDDETQFDTSPLNARTHWGNRLFRFPVRKCQNGDVISMQVVFHDFPSAPSWDVQLQ